MGECPDYRFYYDGHAPRPKDLVRACHEHEAKISHDSFLPLDPGSDRPLVPFASAMALLPASCHRLLPEAVHALMTDNEVIYDLFFKKYYLPIALIAYL